MYIYTLINTLLILCIIVFLAYHMHNSTFQSNCIDDYFDMIVCICIPERKNHMERTFKQWGIKNVEFFDAYVKDRYNHEFFIKQNFISPYYSSRLNTGRICCHYSAIQVYKKFINSNATRLLVFEDDLYTFSYMSSSHFNQIVKPFIENIPNDWEYLNFSKCADHCFKNKEIINNPYWNIPYRPLCRTAIALKKRAAQIIVNETSYMTNLPGDRMIGDLIIENRFKSYATKRIMFLQHREKFGSTLGNVEKHNPTMCIRSSKKSSHKL